MIDQTLYCRDCNQPFTFTAGEQEFYASHGWPNVPGHCPACRLVRKRVKGEQADEQRRVSQEPERRPMYLTTCARCGREAQVPFQPRAGRPVYCIDCYQARRTRSSGGNISRG